MTGQLTVQDSVIAARWEPFLRGYCTERVQEICAAYPDKGRSLVVDFNEVQLHDPDLANCLLEKPRQTLQIGAYVLHDKVDVTVTPKPQLHLRVKDLPPAALVTVRALRGDHLGSLIAVEGLVKKTVEVRPMILEAVFDCVTCGNRIHVRQEDEDLAEPVVCHGCEKPGPWKLRPEESIVTDHQKILLQEDPEDLRGAQAAQVTVYLHDDIVARVEAGKRVRVTGILTALTRRKDRRIQTVLDHVLQAVYVEILDQAIEDVVVTPEDEEKLRAIVQRPDHWSVLQRSYEPGVHGLDGVKEGLLLSLFSGAPTVGEPPTARLESHLLLVGDSALAKTQLLRFGHLLLPRSRFVDAPNATGVGLTAAAVHDDFGGGDRWTINAGAAPMADGSALFADELDKAKPEDLAKLLGLLETGQLSFDKAGLSTTLSARIRLLGACNPKGGRFEGPSDLFEQVELGPALLSRCDLVFALRDQADPARDLAIAKAIGRRYQVNRPVESGAGDRYDVELLRKLLAVALRYTPTVGDEVIDELARRYAQERDQARKFNRPLPRNARSMAGLVRLAIASARTHLRAAVTMDDVDRVVRISTSALRSLGVVDDQGVADLVVLEGGIHRSQYDRIRQVQQVVAELAARNDRGYAREEDVVQACKATHGLEEREVHQALKTLARNNSVYAKGGAGTVAPLNPHGARIGR